MKKINGTEYRMYHREFLNEEGHEGIASIHAVVGKTSSKSPYDYEELILKISDCSKIIDLYFNLDTESSRKNSLDKISKIINILQEFERALKIEAKVAKTRERKRNEKKNEKK